VNLSAEPGNALDEGNHPCADAKDDRNEDKDIVGLVPNAAPEAEVHELIVVEHRVVRDEIHHAVLSDVADDGHSGQAETGKHANQAANGQHHLKHGCGEAALELINGHRVFAAPEDIQDDKRQYHAHRSPKHRPAREPPHHLLPQHPEIKEEYAHEHVVGTHPQRVALEEKHISYQRKEHDCPVQPADFLDEVHGQIGDEEGEEKPCGKVPVEAARLPDVLPGQRLYGFVIPFEQERKEGKVDDQPYHARRYIRNKDSPRPVHDIVLCSPAAHALVEVAGLKEEEGHEVEAPLHDMRPPPHFPHAAEAHDVQTYHSDDAEPAQEVKDMVSLFHAAKVRKKMKSEK